jgi:hypothetical protein
MLPFSGTWPLACDGARGNWLDERWPRGKESFFRLHSPNPQHSDESPMIRSAARLALSTLLALYSFTAHAFPSLEGLWWNPAESGWGITLTQQAGTIFATWFIYGPDGKPYWVIATLINNGLGYSGQVYTTSGTPYATAPFNATETKGFVVGSATLTASDANHASLLYTVNGQQVQKQIERQTLAPVNVAGAYTGKTMGVGVFGEDNTDFTVTVTGNSIHIVRSAFFDGTCIFDGTEVQMGSRIAAQGSYRCSDFSDGTWTTDDLSIVDDTYLVATITTHNTGAAAGVHYAQRFMGSR